MSWLPFAPVQVTLLKLEAHLFTDRPAYVDIFAALVACTLLIFILLDVFQTVSDPLVADSGEDAA